MSMRLLLLVCLLQLTTLVSAADAPAHGFRRAPSTDVACGRHCGPTRDKPVVDDMQTRQANAKADVEKQVAELHARLRNAQASFLQARAKFDLLGIKLGDPQSQVASMLAKEFPQAKDPKTGSGSGSECVPRSPTSRRNGDCIGIESKPSGDPKAINPQTRQVTVSVTDKGRVHAAYYKQSNLYVANTQQGCERERDQFLDGVAAKYGQPFSRSKKTVTWGATMPYEEFQQAYRNGHYRLGGEKSLDGDKGLVNDAQRVIYFQGGFALTATCYEISGGSVAMGIDAFLSDTRLEEQDSSAAVSKPKL